MDLELRMDFRLDCACWASGLKLAGGGLLTATLRYAEGQGEGFHSNMPCMSSVHVIPFTNTKTENDLSDVLGKGTYQQLCFYISYIIILGIYRMYSVFRVAKE